MPQLSRLERAIERLLAPWRSPEQAKAEHEHSEAVRQRSIAARIESEKVREDYAKMSRRISRQ